MPFQTLTSWRIYYCKHMSKVMSLGRGAGGDDPIKIVVSCLHYDMLSSRWSFPTMKTCIWGERNYLPRSSPKKAIAFLCWYQTKEAMIASITLPLQDIFRPLFYYFIWISYSPYLDYFINPYLISIVPFSSLLDILPQSYWTSKNTIFIISIFFKNINAHPSWHKIANVRMETVKILINEAGTFQ